MSGKHLRRHHKDRTTPGSDYRKARVDYERKRQEKEIEDGCTCPFPADSKYCPIHYPGPGR